MQLNMVSSEYNILNQLTEDGLHSETGQNVQLNVEEETRQETGTVVILFQLTVEKSVREMLKKYKSATILLVPVCI